MTNDMNQERERLIEAVIHEAQLSVDRGLGSMDLAKAVHALNQYPLELPTEAVSRHHYPVTSQQAARWMQDLVTDLCGRVFRVILDRYETVMQYDQLFENRLAYEHNRSHAGLTADEVAVLFNGTHQTFSARVSQLRDEGWIVDGGGRRDTRSGRKAIVWLPSDAGLNAVRQSDHPNEVKEFWGGR